MVQVGTLCYSIVLMHHEELKQAIMKPLLWIFSEPEPIFDIYISNLSLTTKNSRCSLYLQRNLGKTK
jgi:hypothetical protein